MAIDERAPTSVLEVIRDVLDLTGEQMSEEVQQLIVEGVEKLTRRTVEQLAEALDLCAEVLERAAPQGAPYLRLLDDEVPVAFGEYYSGPSAS